MIIYNFFVRSYGSIIRIASVRNEKAAQWVRGRHNWRKILIEKLSGKNTKRIWVHCASYGEFEQGRTLIDAIKKQHPDYAIVLSFFSPSGYEAFKNWDGADVVCYLPLDTKKNAEDFLKIIKPQAAIFIKYEFWVNFLSELKKKHIPTFLVSAVFKPHHPFFKRYGSIFRKSLNTFTKLFIQDESSGKLLESIGIKNYEVSGDTRFDRVLEIKNSFQQLPFFETYCAGKKIIVAGSTWPKDEELLIEAFRKLNDPDLKLILVPHEVDKKSISNTEQILQKNKIPYELYSQNNPTTESNVLILDAMGLLSEIYYYATVAYIGGGFNSGIHNCLEPAVFFKPILFHGGDDYHKYNEAVDLLNMQTAKNISTASEFQKEALVFLNDPDKIKQVEHTLNDYFAKNSGTTEKVLKLISWN